MITISYITMAFCGPYVSDQAGLNHFSTVLLQAYCAVITEYGIPSDFVRKSTALLQIKISIAQHSLFFE